MKGKGYRSSSVKAIWIVIAHLAAVAAAVCAAMFVMIYQTGIRLDDRGKSYTESEAFEKQVSNRGSDILVSLAAQDQQLKSQKTGGDHDRCDTICHDGLWHCCSGLSVFC